MPLTSHWMHLCSMLKTIFLLFLLPTVQWPTTIILMRSSTCHNGNSHTCPLCVNHCPSFLLQNPSHSITSSELITLNLVERNGQHHHEHCHRQLYTYYSCPFCANCHLSLPPPNPTLSTMPNLVIRREKATSARIPQRNCPLFMIKRCPKKSCKMCVLLFSALEIQQLTKIM